MKLVSLSEVILKLESGSRPRAGVTHLPEVPSIGGEQINGDGGLRADKLRFITHSTFINLKSGKVKHGDVLIVKDGATTGKTAYYHGQLPFSEVALNEHVFRLEVDPTKSDSRFVYWFLRSDRGQEEVKKDFRGATVGGISRKFIDKVQIPLPPLGAQKRIAQILDAADALRQQRRQALAELDTFLQSTFFHLFGDPVTNPKGWDERVLGELSTIQGGLQVTPKRKACEISLPYLRVANVMRGHLDLSQVKEIGLFPGEVQRSLLEKGDLLIVEGHGNPEEIGRCAVWDGSIASCVHQNHIIKARLEKSLLDPNFLMFFLNSPGGSMRLKGQARTTSGLNTISTKKVYRTLIQVPPLDRQRYFSDIVTKVEEQKVLMREQLRELDSLFAALQQRAFTGKL